MTEPLVSICCLCYNHEPYIRECLEGFMMQKTNFAFEVLIHDDASTDKSAKIIREYEVKYPDIIKPIYQIENQYSKGVGVTRGFQFPRAKGKYIAMCEGDDYWTDPYKLQKQVDFLEANEEYSFCFHDALIFNQKTAESICRIGGRKIDEAVDLKSVIIENNFPTASLVFRNIIDWSNIPEWFRKTAKGDYGLVVLLAEKGIGKYIPDVMSVYRLHVGGVWSGNKQRSYHINEDIKFYNFLYDYFSQPHIRKAIKLKRSKSYQNLGINQIRDGQFFTGLLQVVTNWNFTNDKRFKTPLRKIASAAKTGLKYHLSNTNRNGF
jgi:glycosyltransferase involved in cell wall biosynthesis